MAIDSFKKVIWEAGLITEFRKSSVAELISTKPVKTDGSKVTFNRLTTGDVKDYTGNIEWDKITTTPVDLVFDKKKYFAITMDDLDAVQAVKSVMQDTIADEAAKIKEQEDKDFFATLVAGAGDTIGKTKAIALNAKNVYDNIVDLGTKLTKKKVPKVNRYVVVSADITNLLSKDDRFTKNPNVLENGIVEGQKINGLQVVESEELPEGTMIAVHKSGSGFGRQLQETEAMRLQNAFADGVRGLDAYGSIVLRKEAVVALKYTLETAQA